MLHVERVVIPVAACSLLACGVVLGFEDHSLGDPNSPAKVLAEGGGTPVDAGTETGGILPPSSDPVPPQCTGSPVDKPEVLTDQCGIFVSPDGNDQNSGTHDLPMKTFNAAVIAAAARGYYRVFACTGIYDQRIEITKGGASIVGGLSCAGGVWATGAAPSIIRPVEGDAVLKIHDSTTKILLESLHVEAVTATRPGASPIAAQVTNASSVKFKKVELVAGAGAAGASGAHGELASGGGESGNASDGSDPAVAGAEKTCTCTLNGKSYGTTTGGSGGTDATWPTDGQPDLAGGGAGANGAPCANGAAGANGQSGSNAPQTSGPAGALVNGTWTPTCGANGTDGTIAEGGGGGGAYPGYAGGGGGCGGCPSMGATGGQGGGASIGILVIDSLFAVEETAITTGAGGLGGNGGEAQSGQMGGSGQGNPFGNGCMGGNGGKGGSGGNGGAGAGGISVGILYRGPTPVVDTLTDAKVTVGAPGDGGRQRIPGPTKWAFAPKGFSEKVHAENL